MIVEMTVRVSIAFSDDEAGDPEPGDPLETRMLDAAQEAVGEALEHAENRGFNHEMSEIAGIGLLEVSKPKRISP